MGINSAFKGLIIHEKRQRNIFFPSNSPPTPEKNVSLFEGFRGFARLSFC